MLGGELGDGAGVEAEGLLHGGEAVAVVGCRAWALAPHLLLPGKLVLLHALGEGLHRHRHTHARTHTGSGRTGSGSGWVPHGVNPHTPATHAPTLTMRWASAAGD